MSKLSEVQEKVSELLSRLEAGETLGEMSEEEKTLLQIWVPEVFGREEPGVMNWEDKD